MAQVQPPATPINNVPPQPPTVTANPVMVAVAPGAPLVPQAAAEPPPASIIVQPPDPVKKPHGPLWYLIRIIMIGVAAFIIYFLVTIALKLAKGITCAKALFSPFTFGSESAAKCNIIAPRPIGGKISCKSDEKNTLGLCYKPCPPDHHNVLNICYPDCPANTTEVAKTSCLRKDYGNGVGRVARLGCPDDKDRRGVECFDKPTGDLQWIVGTNNMSTSCPSGTRATAANCNYTRAGGTIPNECAGQRFGAFCTEQCDDGFSRVNGGIPLCKKGLKFRTPKKIGKSCPRGKVNQSGLCYNPPKPGFKCAGIICSKPRTVKKGVKSGTITGQCKEGEVLELGSCYPECRPGYDAESAMCRAHCPQDADGNPTDGWTEVGFNCHKKAIHRIGKPMSQCPEGEERVGLLCYKDCPEGTHTDKAKLSCIPDKEE